LHYQKLANIFFLLEETSLPERKKFKNSKYKYKIEIRQNPRENSMEVKQLKIIIICRINYTRN